MCMFLTHRGICDTFCFKIGNDSHNIFNRLKWFLIRYSFIPEGTFGDIWRHFWLSHWEKEYYWHWVNIGQKKQCLLYQELHYANRQYCWSQESLPKRLSCLHLNFLFQPYFPQPSHILKGWITSYFLYMLHTFPLPWFCLPWNGFPHLSTFFLFVKGWTVCDLLHKIFLDSYS